MKRREVFSVIAATLIVASVAAVAYAQVPTWYQATCSKCGDKSPKIKTNSGNAPTDRECLKYYNGERCGGLCKFIPCAPPG